MTGMGIVVSTGKNSASVRIRKSSACGHDCGECRVCTNPEFETEVINKIGAKPGDTVIIGISDSKVLKMAFLLYILPIIGAFAVCGTVYGLAKSVFFTALSVFFWLVLWFLYIRYYNRHRVEASEILEVVNEKN